KEKETKAHTDGSEDKHVESPEQESDDRGEKGTAPANDIDEQEDDPESGEQTTDEQVSGEKGTAPANDVAGQEDDTASGEQTSDEQVSGEKAEELPNTGIAQNSLIYTVAALLGALGLGSVIASRRRKN